MRKGASEKGAVNGAMSATLWTVYIFTSRTEKLDCLLEREIRQSHGKQWLLIAQHTRTPPKVGSLVFIQLRGVLVSNLSIGKFLYELTILPNPLVVMM
jgi:hypothetical protein